MRTVRRKRVKEMISCQWSPVSYGPSGSPQAPLFTPEQIGSTRSKKFIIAFALVRGVIWKWWSVQVAKLLLGTPGFDQSGRSTAWNGVASLDGGHAWATWNFSWQKLFGARKESSRYGTPEEQLSSGRGETRISLVPCWTSQRRKV